MGVQGLSLVRFHLEAGQTKTCAPEPPAGRFPKFLFPRAVGCPQKLKYELSISSPTQVKVVGGEWIFGTPGGIQIFQVFVMAGLWFLMFVMYWIPTPVENITSQADSCGRSPMKSSYFFSKMYTVCVTISTKTLVLSLLSLVELNLLELVRNKGRRQRSRFYWVSSRRKILVSEKV